MYNVFKYSTAVLVAGAIVAGCATTGKNSKLAYEKYKKNRPSTKFIATGKGSVDNTSKKIANVYGETADLLDDYIDYCDNHRYYVAYCNDTKQMSASEKKKYLQGLSEEKQAKVRQAVESHKEMSWGAHLKRALGLLDGAKNLSSSASSNVTKFSGLSPDMIKKAKAAKHALAQADYSVKSLNFLVKQYRIMQHAKKTRIR